MLDRRSTISLLWLSSISLLVGNNLRYFSRICSVLPLSLSLPETGQWALWPRPLSLSLSTDRVGDETSDSACDVAILATLRDCRGCWQLFKESIIIRDFIMLMLWSSAHCLSLAGLIHNECMGLQSVHNLYPLCFYCTPVHLRSSNRNKKEKMCPRQSNIMQGYAKLVLHWLAVIDSRF